MTEICLSPSEEMSLKAICASLTGVSVESVVHQHHVSLELLVLVDRARRGKRQC